MSEARIVSRADLPSDRWDAAVAAMDGAWLWHRSAFQDTLCTWPGRRDHSVAACDGEGRILGLLPLHVTLERIGPLRVYNLDSFGGPALAAPLAGRQDALRNRVALALWGHAEALGRQLGAAELRCSVSTLTPAWREVGTPPVNPLLFLGLDAIPGQCWSLDLSAGAGAVWSGMIGRARTAIRKAEKLGLSLRPAGGGADAEAYHRLHTETFRRSGATPHPEAYSRALFEIHQPAGEALILFAESAPGRPIAAASFAVFKQGAYYWTAAAEDQARREGVPSLLVWTGIQRLCDLGVTLFDVGDAFPQASEGKLKGLNDFKSSFGGRLVPHWQGRRDIAPRGHRILSAGRALLRALRAPPVSA